MRRITEREEREPRGRAAAGVFLILLFCLGSHLAANTAPAAGPPALGADVDLAWIQIPLRDGAHLGSVLYRPRGPGPWPVILCLTPYTADGFHSLGVAFARRGFAFAATDVRGRGESPGVWEPWQHDGRDGHDAALWLAHQPWSNGKVAILGHSYGGRAVWSTLKEGPEPLAAAVPMAASFPMFGWKNLFTPDLMQWLVQNHGAASHARLGNDPELWAAKLRRLYDEHLPFRQLDRIVGAPSEIFQRFLDHPTLDPFWTAVAPTPADYRRMTLPILSIAGAYDGPDPLSYAEMHHANVPPGDDRGYLIVGPWDHPGALHPNRDFSGISIGPAGVLDLPALIAGWLDSAFRGAPLPAFFQKKVAYYVLGAEEWRYAESLAAIPARTETLYLGSDGAADGLRHPGRLTAALPHAAAADRYVYDPLDIRPGATELAPPDNWITDTSAVRNLARFPGTGLIYEGKPFAKATEIAGRPRFTAWISMDVPDTDFVADLYLIAPDGDSILVGEDFQRARYRRSLEKEELVQPGAIERYDFTFPFHARRAPKGSRLRLLLRSPNSIFWEKNYNKGGIVAEESGADARTAHVTLHHDADHASCLLLPLAR